MVHVNRHQKHINKTVGGGGGENLGQASVAVVPREAGSYNGVALVGSSCNGFLLSTVAASHSSC